MKKITGISLVFILTVSLVACVSRGSTLYYTSDRNGQMDIFSTVIGTDEEVNVTDTPALDEYDPVVSPDGKWIAFRVGDSSKSSIDVFEISNGNRFTVTYNINDKGDSKYSMPVWSPDSTKIAFLKETDDEGGKAYTVGLEGNPPAKLSDVEATQLNDWASSGDSVLFSSYIQENEEDLENEDEDEDYVWDEEESENSLISSEIEWQYDEDGNLLGVRAFGSSDSDIEDGFKESLFDDSEESLFDDSEESLFDDSYAQSGIYSRNPAGVNQRRMTCGEDKDATWSPDSTKLAFISERDGNAEIYVMERDALDALCENSVGNPKQIYRLTDTEEPESDIAWSPDGERLLFVSERDGNKEIYLMDYTGNNEIRLTFNQKDDYDPLWAPDGTSVIFVSELDGDSDIFIMDTQGQSQQRVTNNDAIDESPTWR
jgi:Tol biopolymer transport system component